MCADVPRLWVLVLVVPGRNCMVYGPYLSPEHARESLRLLAPPAPVQAYVEPVLPPEDEA